MELIIWDLALWLIGCIVALCYGFYYKNVIVVVVLFMVALIALIAASFFGPICLLSFFVIPSTMLMFVSGITLGFIIDLYILDKRAWG